jgi:hypothetical protein
MLLSTRNREKPFIRFEGHSISYREMRERSQIAAGVLAGNGVGAAMRSRCVFQHTFVRGGGASGRMAFGDSGASEPQAESP